MKKLLIIAAAILAFASPLGAQMTDEQVVQYVKNAAAEGKSQTQIGKELLAKGVTEAQAERIKAQYEGQLNPDSSSASGLSSSGQYGRRDSRTEQDTQMSVLNMGQGIDQNAALGIDQNAASGIDQNVDLNNVLQSVIDNNFIFGHDIFGARSNVTFEPNENQATPTNYVLGPGDELIIEVWGMNEATIVQTISPEGRISISQVGPIQLSGKTIAEATKLIRSKLAAKYAGITSGANSNVSVSLGKIRTIQVNVMGMVNTPGTYRLSPFTTVFHALYRAGGIEDNGSLRSVKVVRAGKTVADVDIYEYLFSGNANIDIALKEGDVVVVPPYSELVKISGGVKRPMTYELKGGESLEKLVEYAGGFASNAYRKDVNIVRNTGFEKELITVSSDKFASCVLNDGDEVTVGSNLERYANRVEVKGFVFRPGEYQLGGGIATVRQLIEVAGGFTEDAFLERAVLLRELPDLSLETVPVNLRAIFDGVCDDVLLRKNDVLTVSGIHELQSRGTLTINGLVSNPGTFDFAEGTTLEDLILKAGGLQDGASTARVDIARRIYDPNSLTYSDTLGLAYSFPISEGLAIQGADSFVLQPYDVVSVRRSPGFRPQKFITVDGSVVFPGQYVIVNEKERLSDVIERAGGITAMANPKGVMIVRQRKSDDDKKILSESLDKFENERDTIKVEVKDYYNIAVDLNEVLAHKGTDADLVLQEDDRIVVPELVNTVQITGEVMSPNSVVFKPGRTVAYYINDAGGYTENARRSKVYVIYQNGKAAVNRLNNAKVEPGCTIVVPTKPEKRPLTTSDVLATASVASSLTSVVAMLIRLF